MTDPERDPTRTEDVEEKNEALKAIYAVQDALKVGLYDAEWRRQRADDEGSAEIHKKQIEEGQDALSLLRDRLGDLRSRLEEARKGQEWYCERCNEMFPEPDTDRLLPVCPTCGDPVKTRAQKERDEARRRADRLEERVRALFDGEGTYGGSVSEKILAAAEEKYSELGQQVIEGHLDRLRAALDSREDEGRTVWCPLCEAKLSWGRHHTHDSSCELTRYLEATDE